MAETVTPVCDFGAEAPDFSLLSTDGKTYTLSDCQGSKGTLVMFICNHCPFVKAVQHKICRDAAELAQHGVSSVAIMSNDSDEYPEDSFENMGRIAARYQFTFPYLYDESQEVAKAYGAVCTPDFFGYNAQLELQYRGRLDDCGMSRVPGGRRDLFEGMSLVAKTGEGPAEQYRSIGCSLKWKMR